jgi:hypothetical protein
LAVRRQAGPKDLSIPIGPSLEQIVCLASRTVVIGERICEPDERKAFADSC